jgi:hypothetical protein
MCANCASRSGCASPSIVFLLTCSENPCAWSSSASADLLRVMAFGLQGLDQMRQRFGGPAHQAHRVALGLQLLFQVGQQARVALRHLFPACSWLAYTCSWVRGLACLPFSQAPFDRIEGDTCIPGDCAGAASSLCLGGQVLSPLLFDSAWHASADILVQLRAVPYPHSTPTSPSLASNSRKPPKYTQRMF